MRPVPAELVAVCWLSDRATPKSPDQPPPSTAAPWPSPGTGRASHYGRQTCARRVVRAPTRLSRPPPPSAGSCCARGASPRSAPSTYCIQIWTFAPRPASWTLMMFIIEARCKYSPRALPLNDASPPSRRRQDLQCPIAVRTSGTKGTPCPPPLNVRMRLAISCRRQPRPAGSDADLPGAEHRQEAPRPAGSAVNGRRRATAVAHRSGNKAGRANGTTTTATPPTRRTAGEPSSTAGRGDAPAAESPDDRLRIRPHRRPGSNQIGSRGAAASAFSVAASSSNRRRRRRSRSGKRAGAGHRPAPARRCGARQLRRIEFAAVALSGKPHAPGRRRSPRPAEPPPTSARGRRSADAGCSQTPTRPGPPPRPTLLRPGSGAPTTTSPSKRIHADVADGPPPGFRVAGSLLQWCQTTAAVADPSLHRSTRTTLRPPRQCCARLSDPASALCRRVRYGFAGAETTTGAAMRHSNHGEHERGSSTAARRPAASLIAAPHRQERFFG